VNGRGILPLGVRRFFLFFASLGLGFLSCSGFLRFHGGVGEKATPCGAARSPLIEPDVQISRIRLSRSALPQARAGS